MKNGIHYYPRKLFRATTDTLTAVKTQGLFERNFPCFIELTPWPSFGDYHHLYDIFSLSLVKFLSWKKDQA